MKAPNTVYHSRIELFQHQLQGIKKKLFASSMLRLGVFLLISLGIYYTFGNTKLVMGIIIGGIALFLFLVSRHTDLQQEKAKTLGLIQLNKTELRVLERNFHDLPNGEEFKNPTHEFSQDIDLFGDRSFFQYLNRTGLTSGKEKLAQLLTSNDIHYLQEKQESLKELAEKIDFRQTYTAIAQLVHTSIKSKVITTWFKNYKTAIPKVFKWVPKVFALVSLLLVMLYATNFLSAWFLGIWFVLGWFIIGRYAKKVNQLANYVGEVQQTFQQYHLLLGLIETTVFKANLTKSQQKAIHADEKKASVLLKEFSTTIDALERKNVFIFGQLMSGFLLWDLWKAYELEQWITQHANRVAQWFDVIDFFDAYNSLGNFVFNHPSYTFPTITQNNSVLKTTAAVHPLLNPAVAVKNDYEIQEEAFFIITGANMAGKSTFLRTVSLQIIMSNLGLPVCAATAEYSPIKLITSMRTVDSLADDASYFFSELSRLKFIVDQLKTDRYFIILDEILKGTNSTDKAIGSKKFIEKLVTSKSTGIIATHDLSLCEVSQKFPQVKNLYFDAEIINNELHFDYKLKDGICQNMNASFLLKKMEII